MEFVKDELHRRGLIASWVETPSIWRGILLPCASCDKDGSKATHKKCRGWQLAFRGHQALVLAPSDANKSNTQLVIEAQFDMRRPPGPYVEWTGSPLAGANGTFLLRDASTNTLLTRQHLDLASPGQAGPAWHLQLGGVGSGSDKAWARSVAAVRWPSPPTDFMLLVELALYLFHYEMWGEIRLTSPWRQYIAESEDLLLPHYIAALEGYWNQRSSAASWLAVQCNQVGRLRPTAG